MYTRHLLPFLASLLFELLLFSLPGDSFLHMLPCLLA